MANSANAARVGAIGAFGAFMGSGAFGAFGAFDAVEGPAPANPRLISRSLITNHDEIAGTWIPIGASDVDANAADTTDYLSRLSPTTRSAPGSCGGSTGAIGDAD